MAAARLEAMMAENTSQERSSEIDKAQKLTDESIKQAASESVRAGDDIRNKVHDLTLVEAATEFGTRFAALASGLLGGVAEALAESCSEKKNS